MEQSETDWGEWSLNNEGELDTVMADDYRRADDDEGDEDEDADTKEDNQTFGGEEDMSHEYGLYDDYSEGTSNVYGSEGESDPHNEVTVKREVDGGVKGGGQRSSSSMKSSYQELSMPIKKEGMATCEFCGRLGVQDAFYSKTKQFCSLACARTAQKQGKFPSVGLRCGNLPKKEKSPSRKGKTRMAGSAREKQYSSLKTFDWSSYLNQTGAPTSSVTCFKHCLMSDCWESIAVGMKVEIVNNDCDLPTTVYWIATVIRLAGYRALLRYEGFGSDASKDFWLNLCGRNVQSVGWCAANSKPLVPPKTIHTKYGDWKEFLVKRLTGARTLPHNFYDKVQESLHDSALKRGMRLEVVDKMCVSAMRVAIIKEVIGGRLRLVYQDSEYENDDFWCHARSPLVHPIGWSQLTGHKLHASAEYKMESLNKATFRTYDANDALPEMFPKVKDRSTSIGLKFQVGMKLEAIDPLNLATICVATVTKVLRCNYLMIGIDGSAAENGSDWFCYHTSSACIFPVGFCEINNIELTPPRGHKGLFTWQDYLRQTKSLAASVGLFNREIPKHGFKQNMKLEAVDLMEPRLICVGAVTGVVGRLLRIHFDGWETAYDQWIDCSSPDIYPVGWCEMVSYHLEGPRTHVENLPLLTPVILKKKRSKSQIYRGPRKKRKAKLMAGFNMATTSAALLARATFNRGPHCGAIDSDLSQDSGASQPSVSQHPIPPGKEERGEKLPQLTMDVMDGAGEWPTNQTGRDNKAEDMPTLSPPQSPDVTVSLTESPRVKGDVTSSLPPQASRAPDAPASTTTIAQTKPLASVLPSIINMLNSPIKHSVVLPTSSPKSVVSPLSSTPAGVYPVPSSTPHHIPCLTDAESDHHDPPTLTRQQSIAPGVWSVHEVGHFLCLNDCDSYCESFRKKGIDGRLFLQLSREQIANLTGMKVGPSLKIHDLIQALKVKAGINPETTLKISTTTTEAVKVASS